MLNDKKCSEFNSVACICEVIIKLCLVIIPIVGVIDGLVNHTFFITGFIGFGFLWVGLFMIGFLYLILTAFNTLLLILTILDCKNNDFYRDIVKLFPGNLFVNNVRYLFFIVLIIWVQKPVMHIAEMLVALAKGGV